MLVIRSLDAIPAGLGRTVVAIGNFDGVHRGHQAVMKQIRDRAHRLDAQAVAVTFDPHPMRVLRPGEAPRLITPLQQRLNLLAQTGIDATLVIPFTEEFSRFSAFDFADKVLRQSLNAVEVHEGENFRFGQGAKAGTPELERLGQQLGFAVVAHPALTIRGICVSSSEIRRCIAAGDVSLSRCLLGRPFSIRSVRAKGRGIGTRITVPTINLAQYEELVPANGVYVSRVTIGSGLSRETFDAVTNAGNRPTFGEDSYAIESHLLDFRPLDLGSDTSIELWFLARIRAERRFESPDALKMQILRDVAFARRYFHLADALQTV